MARALFSRRAEAGNAVPPRTAGYSLFDLVSVALTAFVTRMDATDIVDFWDLSAAVAHVVGLTSGAALAFHSSLASSARELDDWRRTLPAERELLVRTDRTLASLFFVSVEVATNPSSICLADLDLSTDRSSVCLGDLNFSTDLSSICLGDLDSSTPRFSLASRSIGRRRSVFLGLVALLRRRHLDFFFARFSSDEATRSVKQGVADLSSVIVDDLSQFFSPSCCARDDDLHTDLALSSLTVAGPALSRIKISEDEEFVDSFLGCRSNEEETVEEPLDDEEADEERELDKVVAECSGRGAIATVP